MKDVVFISLRILVDLLFVLPDNLQPERRRRWIHKRRRSASDPLSPLAVAAPCRRVAALGPGASLAFEEESAATADLR